MSRNAFTQRRRLFMLKPTRRFFVLAALCLLGASLTVAATKSKTSLSGVVLNKKGEPVPLARVFWAAADGTTPHTLHTDSSGHFQVASVRPGLYEVRGEANGMWSDWEHNVLVRAGVGGNVTLRLIRETPPQAVIAEPTKSPQSK
jgi:hypothetical protein